MKVTLLGYEPLSFTNNDSGELIEGTNLFFSFPLTSQNGVGLKGERKFIRPNIKLPPLTPGNMYDFDCDTKGKIIGVESYEPKSTQAK